MWNRQNCITELFSGVGLMSSTTHLPGARSPAEPLEEAGASRMNIDKIGNVVDHVIDYNP